MLGNPLPATVAIPQHAELKQSTCTGHMEAPRGIYLDYAATTPTDPEVASVMGNFLTIDGIFGNPASVTHKFGHTAKEAVEKARQSIADLVFSKPYEVIWTSGATESINIAIKGVAQANQNRGKHIVTSMLEHKATLDCMQWLQSQGFSVTYVKPTNKGEITTRSISNALRSDTILVSLMHVNNETGTITDIGSLSHLLRDHGALFHVDAVQSTARLAIRDAITNVDLLSISAHKMYGPKGIGALRICEQLRTELPSQMHGGGHEYGLRPGTLPTHQIAGMGHAAYLVRQRLKADMEHLRHLDKEFIGYLNQIDKIEINGSTQNRAPGILNVHFANVEAESLMLALEDIAISSGSACTSANVEPSHVLTGLGYSTKHSLSSVRFSYGRFTTVEQIRWAGTLIQQAVDALRRIAR